MRDSLGREYAKVLGQDHRGHFGGIERACVDRFPHKTTNREGELVEEAKLQKAQCVGPHIGDFISFPWPRSNQMQYLWRNLATSGL